VPILTELNLRLPNSPGALAAVSELLSQARVNIHALLLEPSGRLRLVVDNHVHAIGTLRDAHHQVQERLVLALSVPNGSGGLAPAARLVADAGVNVEYAYVGLAPDRPGVLVVLGVDDAQRAAASAGV
jgi:hypothetical protein